MGCAARAIVCSDWLSPWADYLVPALCTFFYMLLFSCLVICVWWTNKWRKEWDWQQPAGLDKNTNQWEALWPIVRQQTKHNKEVGQECKKLMFSPYRICNREEEEEKGDGPVTVEVNKNSRQYTYPGTVLLVCTMHSFARKQTCGTLSPKDNRWKNISRTSISKNLKD